MQTTAFNIEAIRAQFPTLHQKVNGHQLVYFDNGATSQKPQSVIDRMRQYYELENANIHRGVHHLSQVATEAFEEARIKIQRYIHAAHNHEVIFTKGTTDGINLVAQSFGRTFLKKGDEILITAMEHHANIVPWQMLCEQIGTKLKVVPMTDQGVLDMEAFHDMLTEKTKFVSIVHISNTLGTINPVEEMIESAHAWNIPVLIDGAQTVPHQQVDVQALDADFFVFSGHKIFGPTGIGILYGKEEFLNQMPPYQGGGDMIRTVTFEKTTYNDLPHKFEAGTPHIAGGIGLGAAVDFMLGLDWDGIHAHEADLLNYCTTQMASSFPQLRIFGQAEDKASVFSFLLGDIHPYDAGTIADHLGIALRTGHHCTQPIMDHFSIPGTMRASFAFYNTREEIDLMVKALARVVEMF